MKFIILILISLVSTQVFSATTTSVSTIKASKKTETEKRFSLEFLIAAEQTKDMFTKKIDGSYTNYDGSLLFHATKNDEFRTFLSTRYIDTKLATQHYGNKFQYFFYEFMYRRKNILTEANNGIYLEAELKNYRLINPQIKNEYGYDGSIIPQLIFKKNWGRKYSAKLKLRRHIYQTNNDLDYTLQNEDRVYLSGNIMLNRYSMFYTQIKYQHKMRKKDGPNYRYMSQVMGPRGPDMSKLPEAKKNQEIVTLHPAVLMFLSRQSMVELYVETKLSNTYDKRDLETITNDEFVFGTAFYLTAF